MNMKKAAFTFILCLFLIGDIEAGKSYSGKSFSSGRSSSFSGRSSSFKPSSSSFRSSSSKPSSSSYKPSSSSSKSYSSKPSSKSYSSSSTKSSIHSDSGSYKPSYKPSGGSIFDGFSSAAKTEQSKINFNQANAPKPSFTTPSGKPKTIDPKSPAVNVVRKNTSPQEYTNYQNRSTVFYAPYSASPTNYHDSFSPFLWGWMFSSSLNSHDRASWMYHHKDEMDEQRYKDMLAKDSQLQLEIDKLKQSNVKVNPEYVPEQLKKNPDIMYDKSFVEASYNPDLSVKESNSCYSVFYYTFYIFVFVFVLWFFFFKDFE